MGCEAAKNSLPVPQHHISAKYAALIREAAVPAAFIRDAADGLDANALALSLGGLKHAVHKKSPNACFAALVSSRTADITFTVNEAADYYYAVMPESAAASAKENIIANTGNTTGPGSRAEPENSAAQEAGPNTEKPFIKGVNGKTGWDVICAEEEKAVLLQ